MINSIKVSALRNGEYLQFMADVLSIVKLNDPAALNVQQQYDALQALFKDLEELFKVPTGSIISTELQELDLRRDNAITGITSIINAYAHSVDPALKSHANRLENHLAVFGSNVARDNYQTETTSIRNIISDWDNQPELTSAVKALGLSAWRVEMEDANNQFNKRYLARAAETGSDSNDTLRAKRLESSDAYYALRDHLHAYFIINKGAEPFGKAVSSLNGLIDNYIATIDRRINKEPEQVAAAVA